MIIANAFLCITLVVHQSLACLNNSQLRYRKKRCEHDTSSDKAPDHHSMHILHCQSKDECIGPLPLPISYLNNRSTPPSTNRNTVYIVSLHISTWFSNTCIGTMRWCTCNAFLYFVIFIIHFPPAPPTNAVLWWRVQLHEEKHCLCAHALSLCSFPWNKQ